MPAAYESLNTQIEAVKTEITSSLAAASYTAQDLVYVAKALETLGNLLGINDLVAASEDAQDQLNELVTDILNGDANATTGKLYVGPGSTTFETSADLTNAAAVIRFDNNLEESSFAQVAFTNDDPTSSGDIIVYASNGDDSTGWTGIGMAGNEFDDATYGITGPHDGYVFTSAKAPVEKTITLKGLNNNVATLTTSTPHGFEANKLVVITGVDSTFNGQYTIASVPTTTSFTYSKTASNVGETAASGTAKMYYGKGNLVLATSDTGSENKIIIAAGGYASGDTQVEITPNVNVHVEIPTASTNPQTGAVTVVGGVGIQGDMNIAGDVTITGTITFAGGGTTVETENLAVTDPAIFVATDNPANIVDFSFIGEYNDGAVKYAAFSKDATDGIWKLSSNITAAPTTSINYAQAGLVYDKLFVEQLRVNTEPVASNEVTSKSYVDNRAQSDFVATLMGVYA